MSGHSHWAGIKHKKQLEDQKRGKIFSKLARKISVAARKGADPETNPTLRQALEEAKYFNLPKENIERAIKRGSGEDKETRLEEVEYEAFGPSNIALIIEGITDNKNRSLAEIKHILQKYGGKLAQSGSVKWLFEKKGVIIINLKEQEALPTKEDLEIKVIEAGAEDIKWQKDDVLEVQTRPEDLEKVRRGIESQGIKIESAGLEWISKEEIKVSDKEKENIEKFFEELDENDDVQNIYSNLSFD